jgi:NACalpha-BTF3-like transcription factor
MSYVPPHLRNRKNEKKEVTIKTTEADFPAFVNERKQAEFKGPSFLSKMKEDPKMVVAPSKEVVVPVTRSRFTFNEARYDDSEEELDPEPEPTPKVEDDGWKTVERKARVKRDKVQDALDNDDGPVVEEEGSAWDEQPEEYETYWDERRH